MVETWITRVVIILGFITAVITLWRLLRTKQTLDQVHVMVNSRYSDLSTRVDQLIKVLKGHGIDIPVDPKDE